MASTEENDLESMTADVDLAGDEKATDLTYEKMVALFDESMRDMSEGEMVTGRIIDITSNDVVVDVGYKSEGLIPRDEFTDYDGNLEVEIGDEVEVLLELTEDKEGQLVLSKNKADKMKVWDDVERAFENDEPIRGKIVDRIKGGLTVDVGVRAFLPGSLADIRPIKRLESLKGEEMDFKVINLDRDRNNVVVSRKAVLEKELEAQKKETIAELEEGKLMPGVVKNITDYGVFIDLGGIDGLLHITDISWGRVNHPSDHFDVGDEVDVVILNFEPERERVSLGYKQKEEDPWSLVDKTYPVGSKIVGTVVSIVDYGAFVELEPGVEGLVHVSEMSWTKKNVNPHTVVSVGEEVECIVSELDMDQRRISLSLRQVERNPWEELAEHHPVGSVIEGTVRNLTDFGAFVEITEGIDGLVHVSDMSWTKRVRHPSEVLERGDTVKARITNIDVVNQRVSLSIKEFREDEWVHFVDEYRVGDTLEGKVVNVTDFGLFIDVYEGLEGLAHVSEIDVPPGESLEDQFRVDDWVRARILRIEDQERKVGLTMRGIMQPTPEEIEELELEIEEEAEEIEAADEPDDASREEREEAEVEAEAEADAEADADAEDAEDAEEVAPAVEAADEESDGAEEPEALEVTTEKPASEPESEPDPEPEPEPDPEQRLEDEDEDAKPEEAESPEPAAAAGDEPEEIGSDDEGVEDGDEDAVETAAEPAERPDEDSVEEPKSGSAEEARADDAEDDEADED